MTQLPTAIQQQIEKEAEKYESSTPHTGLGPGIYMAGATPYAEKWQASEEDKAILQNEIVMLKTEKMRLRNASVKAEEMMERMAATIRLILEQAEDPDNDNDPGISLWNINSFCKGSLIEYQQL